MSEELLTMYLALASIMLGIILVMEIDKIKSRKGGVSD